MSDLVWVWLLAAYEPKSVISDSTWVWEAAAAPVCE